MESSVQELGPTLVELSVTVPVEDVTKHLETSFRELTRHAKVKGFRPGKVPASVVRKLYGRKVKDDVAMKLVDANLARACKEHELKLVAQPQVEVQAVKEGEAFAFKAKVEVRPAIDKVDTTQLKVTRKLVAVTDKDVQREVDRLRRENADMQTPDPIRPAKDNDQLTLAYTVHVDGEEQAELGSEDRLVVLGAGTLIEDVEQALTGMSPGEKKTISVDFDEDGPPNLKGKTAEFHLEVKALQELLLAEEDDEFARDVGEFQTLLELRLDIRTKLEKLRKDQAEAEVKEAVIDRLVETNEIPLPDSMISEEIGRSIQQWMMFQRMQGGASELTEEIQADLDKRAKRKVQAALLLGKIAEDQNLGVDEAAIEAKFQKIAEETGKHVAKVRVEFQGERMEHLRSEIMEERLMEYLMEQATITEEEVTE